MHLTLWDEDFPFHLMDNPFYILVIYNVKKLKILQKVIPSIVSFYLLPFFIEG